MNKPTLAKRCCSLLLPALLAVAGPATAAETLAKVENHGSALVFVPTGEFNELILTVTGPCDLQYRQAEGELFFKLDETTIDGAYTFYLQRNDKVDPDVVRILQRARQNFDLETPKALCRAGKLPAPPASQSGGFLVSQGRIIFGGAEEKRIGRSGAERAPAAFNGPMSLTDSPSPADFVINDDLIVDGSACIGFDCVNGESFGFDTIRLKENNLRIKFDDTSVAASFPRNDWQLTANDSANGGASKFSIDDISGNRTPFTVEANARSHSLYVDDGGRIGSRTSTPSVEIHTIDGDTPTLRLQQDGSSGFAPQTWDVAGNETNFFVRDVTNGSQLPFRIRPDAPTSSIFVDTDGDVGMGTSSPDASLDIEDDGPTFRLTNTGAASGAWDFFMNGNTGRMNITDDSTNIRIPVKIDPDADNNLLRIGVVANGQVDIAGDLVVSGTITPDFVFEADHALESIEEHAEFMWREKHLPAVAPAHVDEATGRHSVNVAVRSQGALEELEKAHIYIEQLHAAQQQARVEIDQLREALARLQAHVATLGADSKH